MLSVRISYVQHIRKLDSSWAENGIEWSQLPISRLNGQVDCVVTQLG